MYNASATFNNLIKSSERMFIYSGEITTTGGDTYEFDGSNIRSGSINRSISGDKLEIGTVYSSEFKCELIGMEVSRYELYNGTITLNVELDGAEDVIPMGVYIISEINQTADKLSIKAYDRMIKFDDVKFSAATYNQILMPYEWLTTMCTACGVTLGMTQDEVEALPNGLRKSGFADVVTDAKEWRDVLGYLAAYLGSYAYIGRDEKLYLSTYKALSDNTIPASFRYTSELSDYVTTYDGIYSIYVNEGIQDYVANENTDGIILDLGTNPFLQISVSSNRQAALKEIIDSWNGIYYVPFSSDVPMNPLYDPGDVLAFTGKQAGVRDVGVISEINIKIGGQMKITCSGDNPRLAAAQDRFTKTVAGLSSEYNNGQLVGSKQFWILHTQNDEQISLSSAKTLVGEIEFEQIVDVQRIGLMFTCEATVSATATVNILITLDDDESYEFDVVEEKSPLGKRIFNSTCGFRLVGKGTHVAKVYMTVTDNALKWSDLA